MFYSLVHRQVYIIKISRSHMRLKNKINSHFTSGKFLQNATLCLVKAAKLSFMLLKTCTWEQLSNIFCLQSICVSRSQYFNPLDGNHLPVISVTRRGEWWHSPKSAYAQTRQWHSTSAERCCFWVDNWWRKRKGNKTTPLKLESMCVEIWHSWKQNSQVCISFWEL